MQTYLDYKNLFDGDEMGALAASREGLLWLKLRSIMRRALLDQFSDAEGMRLAGKTLQQQAVELFAELARDAERSHGRLDAFIRGVQPAHAPHEIERIASELHKMRHFSWGGDYSNALDKFLVDRYIKAYDSYAMIARKLETEIPLAVSGYVMCSWYNHWSSILIENLFRRHEAVLPALGNIKRVDFFIRDVPFDLKTTYLPANYVRQQRKAAGLRDELTELKAAARRHGIAYDRDAKPKQAAYEIAERAKASKHPECLEVLAAQRAFRRQLIRACMQSPEDLLQNLYQEQGAMRFDASNRLFLILADTAEFEDSWKLKRNPAVLGRRIHAYLDAFRVEQLKQIRFTHKAKIGSFTALADAIFVVV